MAANYQLIIHNGWLQNNNDIGDYWWLMHGWLISTQKCQS